MSSHPLDQRTGGRSASQRKLARDGKTWTPTEKLRRDNLMRQFMKSEMGLGVSKAYREAYDAIDWRRDAPLCDTCPHDMGSHSSQTGRCFMKGCDCDDRKRERR